MARSNRIAPVPFRLRGSAGSATRTTAERIARLARSEFPTGPTGSSDIGCGNIWAYYAPIGNTSERRSSAERRFSYSSNVCAPSISSPLPSRRIPPLFPILLSVGLTCAGHRLAEPELPGGGAGRGEGGGLEGPLGSARMRARGSRARDIPRCSVPRVPAPA